MGMAVTPIAAAAAMPLLHSGRADEGPCTQFFGDPPWDNGLDKTNLYSSIFAPKRRRGTSLLHSRRIHASLTTTVQVRKDRRRQLWLEFFSDPSQWWDNRLTKRHFKHPDFIHKTTHEALWIHSSLNPTWVEEKFAAITFDLLQSSGDMISGAQSSFFNGDKVTELCEEGRLKEALHVVKLMKLPTSEDLKAAYVCLLRGCARKKALAEAKQVHALIVKTGFGTDILLANKLMDMYCKCDSMPDALKVFTSMPRRNVYSWTAIISAHADRGLYREAVDLFKQMKETGITPDKVLWTVIISVCANTGQHKEAFELFQHMTETGIEPDKVSYLVILKACANAAALEEGKKLHSLIEKQGFHTDMIVQSTLVDMYAKCGCLEDARKLFNNMTNRDVVSWNAMIAAYAQNGFGKEALELYEQMEHKSMHPDEVTFVLLLKACAITSALQQGKQLHSIILERGIESDMVIQSALLDMYAKCGCLEDARQVFDNMTKRDVISWSTVIAGYAQNGLGMEALVLYEQMKQEVLRVDEVTYLCVLSACSHSGLVDEGRHVFESMWKDGVIPTPKHYACMVDLFSRAGYLADAEDFILKMPVQPNKVVWMSLLGAARTYGNVDIGRRAFDSIVRLEPEDATPYLLLIDIYSAASRMDEIAQIKQEMKDKGLIKQVTE